ncbi:hypothetical protein N7509_006458 [Penicillium cosmopolitanum]|uniref:Peptidase A2 domain-containing protein n=1 Tax=Penicillium cosmopolitanum TaxID=1131564 RepID=A0A9W9W477_9EURO|nr:uncharacterized protein N7509_006458 [Penicillium cosmopolitanum]KAJ5398345.1 hypothetical protein N7509_006458 [Penicillium cosmopolitanum]
MEGLYGRDSSQDAIAQARLQRDFLHTITSIIKKPRLLKKTIKRLDIYMRNPFLEVNFQIDGISPLVKAIPELVVLNVLLQHERIDVNFRAADGRTCMFSAVKCPQHNSLRALISHGAHVDQEDNYGRTPLSFAAELGQLDHVKILVDSDAAINSTDLQGWTPLFWAVSNRHDETIRYLLSIESIYNEQRDLTGRTPLIVAAEAGDVRIIRYLIEAKAKGTKIFHVERDLLIWSIFQGDIVTAQLLLEIDESLANHRVKGRTPLSMAAEGGHIEITRLLIDTGANLDALDEIQWPPLCEWLFEAYLPHDDILLEIENFSVENPSTKKPLMLLAAEFLCVEILQILLNGGADVNSVDEFNRTALACSVELRNNRAVEILLETPGICVDSRDAENRTPLMIAAILGEDTIIKQLLKSNAEVNAENEHKLTPLFLAVANSQAQAVKILLDHPDIRVNQQDEYGRTPFSYAAERQLIQIMIDLIGKGADPHVCDGNGHTGFWWFLQARQAFAMRSPCTLGQLRLNTATNPFTISFLTMALPNPNNKDARGRTWLSWASQYGDVEIVSCFLEDNGKMDKVDINICDGTEVEFSKTPLIWALEAENDAVINLLKEADNNSMHLLVEGLSSIDQDAILTLVKKLIQAGYNLDQVDPRGRTPLHLACLGGKEDVVSALIGANADANSKDHTGKVPLQYALETRSKALVNLLINAPSIDLSRIGSEEWFFLGDKSLSWIQVTKLAQQNNGFTVEYINELGCTWLPRAKQTRLCICGKPQLWSLLPRSLGIDEILNTYQFYWKETQKDFGHHFVTYISLSFPCGQDEDEYPWGIAWTSKNTTEGLACGFISMLPRGGVPNNPSEFFRSFLEHLYHRWNKKCNFTNERVEELRHEQVRKRGRSHGLVDELAKNAVERANFRRCLQSHVEGLHEVVKKNSTLERGHKPELRATIDDLNQAMTAKLDHMERAVRELLQIELAWVSTNEAASFKRLSWITFIFLPLMFASIILIGGGIFCLVFYLFFLLVYFGRYLSVPLKEQ